MNDLGEISKVTHFNNAVCFVRVPPPGSRTIDTDPPDGAPASVTCGQGGSGDTVTQPGSPTRTFCHSQSMESSSSGSTAASPSCSPAELHPPALDLKHQLCRLGYLPGSEEEVQYRRALRSGVLMVESVLIERFHEFLPTFSKFAHETFQCYLYNASTVLNTSHTRCLKMFILSAFDMARDMLITPKKLDFAREKEEELYRSLLSIAVSKISEIKDLISETIVETSEVIQEEAAAYDFAAYGGYHWYSGRLFYSCLCTVLAVET